MKNNQIEFSSKKIFQEIYENNKWHGGGSGYGSEINYNIPLMVFMSYWIGKNNIKSLVDLGCGDLQWMPSLYRYLQIYLPDIGYVGVDVVESLILNHQINHPNSTFIVQDLMEIDWEVIPNSDLYFIKDVLQHWPNENIIKWIDNFFEKKPDGNLMIINCDLENIKKIPQWRDHTSIRDLEIGGFCPLSQNHYPLSEYITSELFSYDTKKVYLIKRKNK
jgi:hypothetical protein